MFSEEHEGKIDEGRNKIKRLQDLIRFCLTFYFHFFASNSKNYLINFRTFRTPHSSYFGFNVRQRRAEASTYRLDANLLRTEADMADLHVKTNILS